MGISVMAGSIGKWRGRRLAGEGLAAMA